MIGCGNKSQEPGGDIVFSQLPYPPNWSGKVCKDDRSLDTIRHVGGFGVLMSLLSLVSCTTERKGEGQIGGTFAQMYDWLWYSWLTWACMYMCSNTGGQSCYTCNVAAATSVIPHVTYQRDTDRNVSNQGQQIYQRKCQVWIQIKYRKYFYFYLNLLPV